MSGIRQRLTKCFSSENHTRKFSAAFADGIATAAATTALILAFMTIASRITGNSIEHLSVVTVLLSSISCLLMTMLLSLLALFALQTKPLWLRYESNRRSIPWTVGAVLLSVPVATMLGMLLTFGEGLSAAWYAYLTAGLIFGLCGIPAAIRLTSRTAFVGRVRPQAIEGWLHVEPVEFGSGEDDQPRP